MKTSDLTFYKYNFHFIKFSPAKLAAFLASAANKSCINIDTMFSLALFIIIIIY